MKIKVKLPVIVRVDNTRAIFVGKNVTTTARTKHVNIRTKYVRKYVDDGTVTTIFLKSADNVSDIMTKNVPGDPYEKHSKHLVTEKI